MTPTHAAQVRRRAWLAWVAVAVIWGTTYLGIKIALETVPPFLMGGLRYIMSGTILAVGLASVGHALPPRATWRRLGILSFFMLFIGNGGVVCGELFVPSGLTAVLNGTSPFWMVTVDSMFRDGQKLHIRQWLGLTLGFAGIVMLMWPDLAVGGVGARGMLLGTMSIQLACVGWAIGSSYTRRHVMPGDVLGSAALQMIFGGVLMVIGGTALGEWSHISFTVRTAWAMGYLTLAGGVVAFAAYSYALQHLDVAIVSLYTYVNPVIAVALGTILLGEAFHVRMVVAAAVIVAGIVVVGKRT